MPEGPSIILLKEEGIQFSGKKSGVLAVTVIQNHINLPSS